MLDAQALAQRNEWLGSEGTAVVGDQRLDLDAQRLVIGHGIAQELHGAVAAFIGIHVGKADSGMIINGHEQRLPAGAPGTLALITGDAMAGRLDASELLDINVQQIPGGLALVAYDGFDWLQRLEQRQPGSRHDAPNGALGHTQGQRNSSLGEALTAQLDDRQC